MQKRECITKVSADFTSAGAGAYTAGDSVGTVQTLVSVAFENSRIVQLDAVHIHDTAGQNKGCKILFFDATPPTLVDNAAFAFGSALPNLVGVIDIDAADYSAIDSKGIVHRTLLQLRMKLADASSTLYAAIITTGAPTYGIGGKLAVDFHFSY